MADGGYLSSSKTCEERLKLRKNAVRCFLKTCLFYIHLIVAMIKKIYKTKQRTMTPGKAKPKQERFKTTHQKGHIPIYVTEGRLSWYRILYRIKLRRLLPLFAEIRANISLSISQRKWNVLCADQQINQLP